MFPPQARFRILTRWLLPGPAERIADLLTRPQDFPRWWGAVYLSIRITDPGDARGIGQTVQVHSKGWLPYRLNWQGRLVAADLPHTWTVQATGDLTGRGTWVLTPQGDQVQVTYDWQVTSDRPLFRWLFPLLRGLMISNHNWAMAQGEAGLRRELTRSAD